MRASGKRLGLALWAGWLLGALALTACQKKPEAAPVAQVSVWPKLVDEWIESDMKAQPISAVYQGRHEYDGAFPDWSDAGLKAEAQRLKDWEAKARAVDAATLSDAEKFERDYLLSLIDGRLFWLETADWPHKNPTWYYFDPTVYLDRPYADIATRMKAYTLWASHVPNAAAQIKANLKGPLPKAFIDIGTHSFGPLGDFLKTDVVKVFKDVGDPAVRAEFEKQNNAAAAALADLQQHMLSLRATQTDNFAMGPELFAKMIYANERVDTPLAELEQIGIADLKRNQAALKEACAAYAPGKSVKACTEKAATVKPDHDDPVGFATKQLVELRRFVEEHQVVSIPGTEEAKVKQSPPYNSQNSAYIDVPGPYDVNMPSFYNVSAPDPTWPKAKQHDYIVSKSDLLFTSVHEVWPGHFLQFLHSNRSKSIFGKLYVGYAFAEGWAHYAEEMMWEEGLGAGDPQTHIGQLSNALKRNARFLSAIGLHTKGMTLEQSRRMFREEGFQSEGESEQQAARGAYDPAYLNYTMGKLMIRKLRADWCARHGGADDKKCWRDFHDAFLSYGGPPIPLVRGAMLGEPAKSVF
ncbi:MAG TPA: DUF885 domain-containing protein [Steroidobacteraceae bacterium]|nr:DUF885 domain-containing protein [Steroidobacteraceae bacterium]